MRRRNFIATSSIGAMAVSMPVFPSFLSSTGENRFGVADASYMMRRYRKMESAKYPPFGNALDMIAHCHSLGFGGMQVGVGGWDKAFAALVRNRCEELNVFVEGQIRMPEDETDLKRFEAEILAAKEAGITIFRSVSLSGRRYENFKTLEDFKAFKAASILEIERAEPIVRKHQVKLAMENHKDWRISEMIKILEHINSEWVGVTLDTGNNIALLEDPMEVVEALAPYAFSVHLKDMGVQEYPDGFLLSEVNLGEGFLDIAGMIQTIKKHNPEIRFNLEMITRDPLKVPCLTKEYWATFEHVQATDLAQFLHKIKQYGVSELPVVSHLSIDEQLALEVENNRKSMVYAKNRYGFK